MPNFMKYSDGKLVATGENLVEVTARATVREFRTAHPEAKACWDGEIEANQPALSGPAGSPLPQTLMVVREVLAERVRQYRVKGRTPQKDDAYEDGTLAQAAVFLVHRVFTTHNEIDGWPWPDNPPKPQCDRDNLVRATAMLIAEIESLDRKENRYTAHLNVGEL